MDTTTPFAAAPRLVDPRHVAGVELRDADAGGREPRITIGYGPGSRFHRPEAGCGEASCPVRDTMERTWCHLNFFRYKAFVHASVPRVACPERGAGTVTAPWARPGGGVRTPVRGDGRGTGEKPAGRGHRRTGRRARHGTVAVHPPLRGRGAPVRGLHGRGGDRRRRDRPQGPPVHHRRRRPGGARRDPRGAGQGLGHGETVRDGPAAGVKRDPAKRRSKTAGACGMRECLRDILAYFDHRCANAIFEGPNGIIQHVETRSRGFGNMDCSSTMIYLTRGRPGLNTVTA